MLLLSILLLWISGAMFFTWRRFVRTLRESDRFCWVERRNILSWEALDKRQNEMIMVGLFNLAKWENMNSDLPVQFWCCHFEIIPVRLPLSWPKKELLYPAFGQDLNGVWRERQRYSRVLVEGASRNLFWFAKELCMEQDECFVLRH